MKVDIGDGVRLFFDVVGSGLEPTDEEMVDRPTLLLLHGGPGGDHSSFRPYFDRFADTHQVVYLDHRGNGRSDARHDPTGWDLDTWADDVVRFCDALGIESPAVIGNSFGGFVAMHYAARHPEHPSKVVLSSTQCRVHTDETTRRFEELGGARARELYEAIFVRKENDLIAEYREVNLPLYNKVPSPFGPKRTWMNTEVLAHFNEKFAGAFDLRDDPPRIKAPTLVLAGADDPMTPAVASEELMARLSDGIGQLEIVDDCGHGSYRDQPEQTETILRAFLAD